MPKPSRERTRRPRVAALDAQDVEAFRKRERLIICALLGSGAISTPSLRIGPHGGRLASQSATSKDRPVAVHRLSDADIMRLAFDFNLTSRTCARVNDRLRREYAADASKDSSPHYRLIAKIADVFVRTTNAHPGASISSEKMIDYVFGWGPSPYAVKVLPMEYTHRLDAPASAYTDPVELVDRHRKPPVQAVAEDFRELLFRLQSHAQPEIGKQPPPILGKAMKAVLRRCLTSKSPARIVPVVAQLRRALSGHQFSAKDVDALVASFLDATGITSLKPESIRRAWTRSGRSKSFRQRAAPRG